MFGALFIAELGDKIQLATLLFSVNAQTSHWIVFFAASGALGLEAIHQDRCMDIVAQLVLACANHEIKRLLALRGGFDETSRCLFRVTDQDLGFATYP